MRVRAGSGSTGTVRAMLRRGDFDGPTVLPLLGGGSVRRNLKLPADCSSSHSASWLWSIGLTRR
jgi:hypothetical protein